VKIELRKILIVDDSPNDVELMLEALATANLANDIVVARDGQEALDYLDRQGRFAARVPENPAVVILDLKLPKVSGHDVLHHIRSSPGLRHLPVVVLTSSNEEKDRIACYEGAVNGYVVKPARFEDFVEAVKGLGVFWVLINEPPPAVSGPEEAGP
jgi:CheY-like chemotaxis protein